MRVAKEIWRRLPVGFRRGLARGIMRGAPPLPEASAASLAPTAPVIVVGFLTSPSGLGQAARLALRAFERQGRDAFGVDLSSYFFESETRVPFAFRDGRRHRGPARVLININAPYLSYVYRLLGRAFLQDKHITGYWAWELASVPESWREGFSRVHHAAAPSVFVADAIRAIGGAPQITVAPHPVAIEALPALPSRVAPIGEKTPFLIASAFNVASGFERKNPLALITAFKQAFGARADVRLRLLASNAEHFPAGRAALEAAAAGDARIEISYAALDRAAYWRWFDGPDLYASLHRGEGFALTIAEAMLMGVPVMATNWSANAEYMNERNSIPIAYALGAVSDPQQKYAAGVWAEPSLDHAAEMLRRAVSEREWLARIAAAAREDALRLFSRFDPWS